MNEESLFQEALSRSGAERAAFLEQACAGQPELRAAVEALLAAHDRSGNVLDRPPPMALGEIVDSEAGPVRPMVTGDYTPEPESASPRQATTADYRPNSKSGTVIAGRYTLVEKIGEGGMGEVWVAKQTEPVKRKVALKLIKAGMDTRAVVQRFEQERQALALMDHPNIARVLDGGTPFFVMELVNGAPLTRFCDEARLGIRDRLELFVPICQAVQHAHQKGIVHRDLKPSNILVTLYDGKAVPKVIDFGVAKATGGKLIDESLSTHFGAVVGTLEYMAPEQAGLSAVDIDTRADIYSLGVILYELLTGLKPHDSQRLRKAALSEMVRILQEEEPSKPSTRLSTADSLPSLAALRQTEPKKLMAMLRGELDWVVMKCLEKQRDRRYETANGLARDIQRYLADEMVEARPPSAGYRLRKFARKHRAALVSATAILVLLVAGLSVSLWQMSRAIAAEEKANANAQQARDESNAKELALKAEQQARADETKARQQAFAALRTMTAEVVERKFAQGTVLTENDRAFLRGVIAQFDAFAAIKGDDADSRTVRAEGRYRVGIMRYRLGELEEAEQDFNQALSIFKQLAADFPTGPEFRVNLGRICNNRGLMLGAKGRPEQAEQDFDQALSIQKQLVADFPSRPEFRQQLATTHNNRGALLRELGRLKEAEKDYDQALTIRKQLSAHFPARPEFRQELATSHNNRAVLLIATGRLGEAEQDFDQALSIQKQLATDFPTRPEFRQELARSHNNRGGLLRNSGRLQEAEKDQDQALSVQKRLVADFPLRPEFRQELAGSHYNRGILLSVTRRLKEAEKHFDEALNIQKQLAADFLAQPVFRHELARTHNTRGDLLRATGRLQEAKKDFDQALSIEKQLAADLPNQPDLRNELAGICLNLALLHLQQGNWAAAKRLLLEGAPNHLAALKANPRHPIYRQSYRNHLNMLTGTHALLLEPEDAVRTAEIRRDLGWSAPADAYDAACFLSLCIRVMAEHNKLDDKQRREAARFYGDAAMKLLCLAVSKGYKNVTHMKKDPVLYPLRRREDFQKLVAQLEGKGK
jgi:serine/threonine protein kinase/Tfp pilus assembly protein PilF